MLFLYCTFLTVTIQKGDKERAGTEEEDSDEEEQSAYISTISKKALVQVRLVGARRILRSGSRLRFPPTDMIMSSNKDDGTYKRFDIDQRVATILNNFTVPSKGKTKRLFSFQESTEIKHLRGFVSYTAAVQYGRFLIRPSTKGCNCFWGTGYVGTLKGVPFYSSKANARRSVALRVLVDYFAYAYQNKVTNSKPENSKGQYWPDSVMNKTSPTLENFVVLWENNEHGSAQGKGKHEDYLFCILVRHSSRYTLLVPETNDYQPWREVAFHPSNWNQNEGSSEKKRKIDYVGLEKNRYR